MSYDKLPAIEGGHGGCIHCGFQQSILPMESLIAVGFGYAAVSKDSVEVYNEKYVEGEHYWACQDAENEAQKDPDHDWRIHIVAPLSERHYQRQGENKWILYKKGVGFA